MHEFIKFLTTYFAPTEMKSSQSDIIANSRSCVLRAEEGMLGKLGRLFNDFPLKLNPEESETKQDLPAIDSKLFHNWVVMSYKILAEGNFELGTKERLVWNEKEKKHNEKEVSTISVDQKSKDKIHALLREIIFKACEELLDDRGQLHPELVKILHLQKVVASCHMQPIKMTNVIAQIIYSYCSQVVISHIASLLPNEIDKQIKDQPEVLQAYIMKLNQFNVYVEELIFDKYDVKLTPLIQKVIQDYIDNLFLYDKPLFKRCADELKQVSFLSINDIIQEDLNNSFDLNKKLQKLDYHRKSISTINLDKIKFWIEVMDVYRQEFEVSKKEDALLRLQSVYMGLSPIISGSDLKLPPLLKAKFDNCAKGMEIPTGFGKIQTSELKDLDKSNDDKVDHMTNAKQILSAVNNHYLVDHLLQYAIDNKILSSSKHKDLITIINGFKLDNDILKKSSEQLFSMMMVVVEKYQLPKLDALLLQYKAMVPDTEESYLKASLFGRSRSDAVNSEQHISPKKIP